jgi:hypothetical protein
MVGEAHVIVRAQHDLPLAVDPDDGVGLALNRGEIGVIAERLGDFPILPFIAFMENVFFLAE